MRFKNFTWIIVLSCTAGCGARLVRHSPAFTANVLRAGDLCVWGISSGGGGLIPQEESLQEEVLRQFHLYWSNLIILPTRSVDECAGSIQRRRLLKIFSENGIIELHDLQPFQLCKDRARFLLLLNFEDISERRLESSREDSSLRENQGDAATVWERRVRLRLRLRAAIYDLQEGSPVWEAVAIDSSSNGESSYYHMNTWPMGPEIETVFRGALFQLQHSLSHDLSGPHIPWFAIDRDPPR